MVTKREEYKRLEKELLRGAIIRLLGGLVVLVIGFKLIIEAGK